jgi:hypothetical protein
MLLSNGDTHPLLLQVAQQSLSCKEVKKGSQRAALPHTRLTPVVGRAEPIDHCTTVCVSEQQAHPSDKTIPNPQSGGHSYQKVPPHRIVCLSKIKEGNHSSTTLFLQKRDKKLQKTNAITNLPVRQESALSSSNEGASRCRQPACQDLGQQTVIIIKHLKGPIGINITSHPPRLQDRHYDTIQEASRHLTQRPNSRVQGRQHRRQLLSVLAEQLARDAIQARRLTRGC